MLDSLGRLRACLVLATTLFAAVRVDASTLARVIVPLADGVQLEFVRVPGGAFSMGSEEMDGEEDEMPRHQVVVPSFHIGIYEVTQAQWRAVMGTNPSHFRGDNLPVENVSWREAQHFILELRKRTGLEFALPTEVQWEYACRAGSTTRWACGDAEEQIANVAWYAANAEGTTHPAGLKRPNDWGIHDMHGNVGEWTADVYEKHAYSMSAGTDRSPSNHRPSSQVVRGGSWGDNAGMIRSAYRNAVGPDEASWGIGLRLVLLAAPTPTKANDDEH